MKIDDDWTGDDAWYLACASGNPHDWRGDACIACGIPAPAMAMAPFRPMSCGYVGPAFTATIDLTDEGGAE